MKISPLNIFAVIIVLPVALMVLLAFKKNNPFIFLAAIIVLLVASIVYSIVSYYFLTPPEYSPDEIVRGPDNPTVTMIAREGLIAIRFFENQVLVAKAEESSGIGGIALSLEGDPTEYMVTSDGNGSWEVGVRLKRDIRLRLLAGGKQIATAKRVLVSLSKWRASAQYVIDCSQGRFELVRLKHGKFALRRGDTVLGIVAMPLAYGRGILDPLKSRIELPASLPLATRLFLAMFVDIEDRDRTE